MARAEWVLEEVEDPNSLGNKDTYRRTLFSAVVTLTLGVLGSSVLPIPFAISKTGVLVGCLTMLLVAYANDLTSCLLIRAAAFTGKGTYEALAEWAGGRRWKVLTQISLIVLLWGGSCGGLALVANIGSVIVEKLYEDRVPPHWANGQTVMVALVALVLYPMCLVRKMRQLEQAATAGVAVVLVLIGVMATKAVRLGFPAIRTGELPLWSLKVDAHLPEAFSIVGYAFYMQPMMMPLLTEMPPGQFGVRIMRNAVHATLYGVAFLVYFAVGLFGAATFGQETHGNVMWDPIVTGRWACVGLYLSFLVYLCLCNVTGQYALRASLDLLLFGEGAPFTRSRQVLVTTLQIGTAMAVALAIPDQAEKIYAVVGATGVCLVSYVIPVFVHLQVLRAEKEAAAWQGPPQQQDPLTSPLLEAGSLLGDIPPSPKADLPEQCLGSGLLPSTRAVISGLAQAGRAIQEVGLPVLMMLTGVAFSLASLWVALAPFLQLQVGRALGL